MSGVAEKRIREWIAALVSGDYKQTTDNLRSQASTNPGYCCLGVICQLQNNEGWGHLTNGFGHALGSPTAPNGYLGKKAASAYHLTMAGQKQLAKLNDGGHGFGEVAVFIAEQLGRKLAARA